jgi:hypothetical protein
MMKRRYEAGQTLPIVALGMLTFLAAAGLAIDMGYLRYEKRLMQSAADSAALAAATDLNLGNVGAGVASNEALAVTQANGFQDGVNNTTVTVTFPGVNPGNAVRVSIQKIFPSFFMQVSGINTSTISAAGTATLGSSNGCIYALGQGGGGLNLNGVNAGINAPNCDVLDNGPLTGTGDITAASVGVYGAIVDAAGPTPAANIAQPAQDPLLYVQQDAPAPALPCTVLATFNATSGPLMNGVASVSPGTYCGITIDTGAIVTFNPGLYILTQSGLTIMNTGIATGSGVVFYNAPGSTGILFNGTGNVTLVAPTGAISSLPGGILFYQDPANGTAADLSEGGSGNVVLSGILYFPGATLTVAGSLNPGTNAVVIAHSVTLNGTIPLNADSTSSAVFPGGSPLQNVSLVE